MADSTGVPMNSYTTQKKKFIHSKKISRDFEMNKIFKTPTQLNSSNNPEGSEGLPAIIPKGLTMSDLFE